MNHESNESILSDYINALATFTALLTPSGHVVLANKAATGATGLADDNFIGKALKDCQWWNFSRESQNQVTQDIKSCALGIRIDRQATIQLVTGSFIHIRFILTPIIDNTGQISYLVAEGQDITASRDYLRKLSTYINTLTTFTAQLTPSGHIELLNQAAADAAGLPIESFTGKVFKDCYWWNFSRESQELLAQDIEDCVSGVKIDRETTVRVLGDHYINVQLILSPIRDTAGQVIYLVAEGHDITQRIKLELSLRQEKEIAQNLASYDYLTGLANRRNFLEYAEDKISLAQRRKEKMALFFIDLDGFKAINDDISHQAGDMVLKTLGKEFNRFVRKGEKIARLGGDEFAMLIYGYKKTEELESVAKRLIKLCDLPISIAGTDIKVSMSIGISTYPRNGNSIDKLLSSADEAMYKIKRTTKGAYTFAD